MLNQDDLKLIEAKGITESTIDAQLKRFAVGFPALKIEAVATVENGIVRLDDKKATQCLRLWKEFTGTIEKFVPASGAAMT